MKASARQLVVAVFLASLGVAAQACPRNADSALKGAAVGQDMVVNGLPVQIQQVSSKESVESLIDRVEAAWTQAGFDVKRRQLGPWSLVSALSDDCLSTLQLMQQGEAVGFFAIGEPSKARPAVVRHEVAFPPGAQIVSTVAAKDGPRMGVSTILAVGTSVADTTDYFRRSLAAAGWKGLRSRGLQTQASLQNTAVLSALRDGELVQVVIFPAHGSTTAVINRADAL